jgi:hypothetical protein
MLRSQIVVNLLPELRVCMDLMGPGFIVGVGPVQLGVSVRALDFETNEFHKRLSILGLIAPTPRGNDETSWRVATKGGLTSDASKLQVNLEIALSGASARLSSLNRFFRQLKVRRDVGLRNPNSLRNHRTLSSHF